MSILHFDTFYFSSKNQKIIDSAIVFFEEEKEVLSEGKKKIKYHFCFKARRQGSGIIPKEIKLVKFYFPKLQPK